MTDQTYKLVPVEPTEEMLHEARTEYYLPATVSMEAAIRAAIASAPEPVCEWTFVGIGFDSECGWHVEPDHSFTKTYPFCPHCGRKVEVVDE